MPQLSIATLVGLLSTIIAIGTVFFRWAEGWSWVDAYFFSVVTLSTVGYGEPVPVTVIGKLGTTVFIFLGLGVFALVIQKIGFVAAQRRELHRRPHHTAPQPEQPNDHPDSQG
jgi:voltage-gated potassium channel